MWSHTCLTRQRFGEEGNPRTGQTEEKISDMGKRFQVFMSFKTEGATVILKASVSPMYAHPVMVVQLGLNI